MRTCLFCPNPANSREHVWADWLKDYVPRTQINYDDVRIDVDEGGGEFVQKKHRSGDPRSKKLRVVCAACNNSWMSQIQEIAKPHLIPLMEGRTHKLSQDAQAVLSGWAALLVVIEEQTHGDLAAISEAERAWIKRFRKAPRNWLIWLGSYVEPRGHSLMSRTAFPIVPKRELAISPAGPRTYNGQASTFLVGKLLVHTLSAPRRLRFTFPPPVAEKLRRIWPLAGNVAWPPDQMTEPEFVDVAHEGRRRIDRWRQTSRTRIP